MLPHRHRQVGMRCMTLQGAPRARGQWPRALQMYLSPAVVFDTHEGRVVLVTGSGGLVGYPTRGIQLRTQLQYDDHGMARWLGQQRPSLWTDVCEGGGGIEYGGLEFDEVHPFSKTRAHALHLYDLRKIIYIICNLYSP